MKSHLLRVGKGRNDWADAATQDFARRLPRQMEFTEALLRPEPFRGDIDAVKKAEGARILAEIKEGDRLIALDERGELPTTEAFNLWFDEAARTSARRLVFAIGGPYGHDPAVRARAWKVLAFSRMVVNHELARVLLVEQLYRVSSLRFGGGYHHGGAEEPPPRA
jgi:23S rRNA (pseudouridine1915-N3)-methyltransferase